ncbi:exported protein of unknown function [Nitrospira moscoviensis]|uniref:Uncharacterized protein n=1 Tax=Nitrospira moscoviensis TaxID=42253 RepID=A0A0K2G7U5_NITMO|nr:exported protein of unknown function [Nitrospira moscoviensis]
MAQLVKPLTKETLIVDRLPAFLLCLVVLSLVSGTAAPGHARDTRVVVWNGIELQAVRDTGMGPPMTARALAMMHTAMFDAWAVYDPVAVGTILGEQPAKAGGRAHRPEQGTGGLVCRLSGAAGSLPLAIGGLPSPDGRARLRSVRYLAGPCDAAGDRQPRRPGPA